MSAWLFQRFFHNPRRSIMGAFPAAIAATSAIISWKKHCAVVTR